MMRKPAALASVLFAAATSLLGCVGSEYDELEITCEGKCDGLSSIKSLVADAKKLDLHDLINVSAGYATEALNDALSIGNYVSLEIQPTELYAPASVAADDLTIKDLDRLVAGLASQYGETALTTEVNKIRAEHLAKSGKRVFAESAFKLAGNLGHNWGVQGGGFGKDAKSGVSLGFEASAELEARTITAHDRENAGLLGSPLAAIKASRGFVLPRSVADIRKMEPGESFALSGRGKLGINLGAGVPILIANPTAVLTYGFVVSAGLRSVLEGQMDVQLVRVRGDQVVLDVGVRSATLKEATIALTDGFGISGLLEKTVKILGQDVDLGKLLDKALKRRITDKLSLIKGRAERTNTSMRMSVARLRFDLAATDVSGGREAALAQALKGDVRLAQALAARGDSGVIADFDMTRSGASATSHAGIDVVGMSFFNRTVEGEGTAVIQTPGGSLALMWDSLHKEEGYFFSSHGLTRVSLAGLTFDPKTPGVGKGESNVMIQTEEGDDFMPRDKVIDQIDSAIVAIGGVNALRAIERKGNELERLVNVRCPLPNVAISFKEECNIGFNFTAESRDLKKAARDELAAAITNLPAPSQELLMKIGDLRLAAQSLQDPDPILEGPTASIVFDYRLDDAALRGVFKKDATAFKVAVTQLMEATQLNRTRGEITAERTKIRDASTPVAEKMAATFAEYGNQYERLVSIDGARIETLGEIGGNALEVRYPVDSRSRPDYEKAISQSIAQARTGVFNALYDKLRDQAKSMPKSGGSNPAHPERIASFALLSLAAPESTEVRFSLVTQNQDSGFLALPRERYDLAGFKSTDAFAPGPKVKTIAAGQFDIATLMEVPK